MQDNHDTVTMSRFEADFTQYDDQKNDDIELKDETGDNDATSRKNKDIELSPNVNLV